MSPVLPFDIIAVIIDIVAENNDGDLLKELALVSHSFLQICSKHLFATVELHSAIPQHHVASSKKGFVKLLNSRPNVVKYIRKLTYKTEDGHGYHQPEVDDEDDECQCPSCLDNEDDLLSPILPNLLRTISLLNCLKICALNRDSISDWKELNSSMTSAFLHLMNLPTINHIDLSFIGNFPLYSLASSVNLRRLDISHMWNFDLHGEDSYEIVQSMPKIREFHNSESHLTTTTTLLHAKRQDGRPAFNFVDLRRVSMPLMSLNRSVEEENIRYLLQDAKLLEKLHLSVRPCYFVGLHGILSPIARTLKVLDLTVPLYYGSTPPPLAVLCRELEAMARHNILEALSLSFDVYTGLDAYGAEGLVGSIIQKMEKVLVKPGWSALRRVSFKFSNRRLGREARESITKLTEVLQFLRDKYLNISKLEFDVNADDGFSFYVIKCEFEF